MTVSTMTSTPALRQVATIAWKSASLPNLLFNE
jgi:hypothetical protein